MICLTGDVHQRSFNGPDNRYSSYSEAQLARLYCEIAERFQVKVTLFITGKTCVEERRDVQRLSAFPNCEIGGHTFSAFQSPLQRVWKRLFASPLGPRFYQQRDIQRTISVIERTIGKRIHVWRNHAYCHDSHTYSLLHAHGIRTVSDAVSPDAVTPEQTEEGLLSLPINTQPDHEILFHGKYVPGHRKPKRLVGRWTIKEWGERVQEKIVQIEANGGIGTILAHPLCMEVADGMTTFKMLCQILSRFQTSWVSEISLARHNVSCD